jgi:hypothetical protein
MRLHRGIWVGACLLLAAAGCGKDDKKINDVGVYSPILTGISSNHEPAARGAANLLTAQVTNVNGLTLKYHWSVEAGTLAESTTAAVTWTPPDTIAAYHVTVSIEADDGDKHFFKTVTVQMSVDNEFTRWTNTEAIKFDPAPTTGSGVLYAEYHNPTIRTSDAYRVDSPLGPPVQLTTGFFSVAAPSPRADQVDFAFTARKRSTDSISIYLLPFGGGDTAAARVFEARNAKQTYLASPRFPLVGTLLAYVTDSITPEASSGYQVVNYRNGADLNVGPLPLVDTTVAKNGEVAWLSSPSWGPDHDGNGVPDSVLVQSIFFPGTFAETFMGIFLVPLSPPNGATTREVLIPDVALQTPDWSPDGRYIVFTRRNPGTNDRDIWIMSRGATDISQAVRVTSGPADDSQPRFSADGNSIFFVSNRVNRYGVTGIYGTERRGTNIWSVAHFDRP